MQSAVKVVARLHGQLIRLPDFIKVQEGELALFLDVATNEIVLKPGPEAQRKRHLDEFFRLIRDEPFPDDFSFRDETSPAQYPGDPFADNAAPRSGV